VESETLRLSQLGHLNGIIERLARNSFTIKGWAVTVASGFFGFAVKDAKPAVALVGLIPILIFWVTDSYYLAQERHFRQLYNSALHQDQKGSLQITGVKVGWSDWVATMTIPVVAGLYVALLLCCALIGIGLFVVASR
jgi:hypothetical protein